ncbi:MAG: response regulator transcription factor [Ktedonobacterales bacterium]
MSQHPPHTSPKEQSSEGQSPASRLVLIAEDDEPIALALAMIVEDEGYRVLHASDGQEALDMALRYHPALIITDLMMPRMNGAQLIAAIRSSGTPDTPTPSIVIMTAAASSYTQNTSADALLRKPFDIREVEKLLRRFLGTTASSK